MKINWIFLETYVKKILEIKFNSQDALQYCMRIISVLLVLIVSFLSPMVPHLIEPYQDGTDLDSIVQTQFVSGRSGQIMMSNTVFSDTFGGSGGSDYVVDVMTDGSGNHVATGMYAFTANIGSSSYESPNGFSPFVGKISAFGTWLWVLNATNVEHYAFGTSIDIDSNGMIYVTGCGYGTYKFGAYTLGSPGEGSNFVIKINPQGNLVWAIDAIGEFACDLDSSEIVVDGNGEVGVVGTIYDSIMPSGWSTSVEPSGYQSAFFAKVNSGGSQWDLFEPIGGDYGSIGRSIDIWSGSSSTCSSSSNNFLIGGTYANNLVYDTVNFTTARYDDTGFVLWLCGDDASVHYAIAEGQYQGGASSVIKSWYSSNHFSSWNSGSAWSYSTSSTNYDSCTGRNNLSSSDQYLFTYDCNYPNNLGFTSYATSPTFSGSGYSSSNTYTLSFSRLLGIESNSYDNAVIEVNYYGTWYSIWSNPSYSINDVNWNTQTIDITNYFPGNPYFQIRFGIGSTDGSVAYTGWNIDDVKIIRGGGTSDDGESTVSKVRFVSSSGSESCVAVVGTFDTTLNWHTSTSTFYDVATTSGGTNQFSNIICADDTYGHYSDGIALVSEPSWDGMIDADMDTASGELRLLGKFSGTQSFDGTSYQASGCTDLYVAVQDTTQGSLDSVTLVGGSSCDSAASFHVSNNGNFVLGGWLSGSYTYGTTNFETPDTSPDGYVASVTSSGTFTWITQIGGKGGTDISYDSIGLDNGDSVQIGYVTGEFTVNGSLFSSSGLFDAVLIKRDSSGAVTQVKKIGTSGIEAGFFIEVDSQSNIYIAGYMECASPPTISHSAGNNVAASCPSSSSSSGMYVAKLDTNLDPAWMRSMNADWSESRLFMLGDAPVLATLASPNSDVVASSSTSYTVGDDGSEWVLTKYNKQSGNPEWMNAIKAVNKGTELEYLSADSDGTNLYLTGSFIGTLQFDSVSTIASSGDDGTYDSYIASISNTGTWQWALAAGGSSDEIAMTIQVTDKVYAAGTFTDSMVAGSTLLGSTGQGIRPYLLTTTTGGSWIDAQQIGTSKWEPLQIKSLSNNSLAFFGESETDIALAGGLTLTSQAFSSHELLFAALYDTQSKQFLRGSIFEDVVTDGSNAWTIVLDHSKNLLFSSYYSGVDVPNALQGGLDDGSYNGYIVSISVDWDGDEVMNEADACPIGASNWVSDSSTDHDTDGCKDVDEDEDDDNDGRVDLDDSCSKGLINWTSSNTTLDYDSDGCHDATEDQDDDNDGIVDPTDEAWGVVLNGEDFCPRGTLGWTSNNSTDHDGDGCADESEDSDDDQDGLNDTMDHCPRGKTWWDAMLDHDMDGCFSPEEDQDADNDGIFDDDDACPTGQTGWNSSLNTDHDADGCHDELEDADDDNDGVLDVSDTCPSGALGWTSSESLDHDQDGCHDELEDADDDNDGVLDTNDVCPTGLVPIDDEFDDYDSDGCENSEDTDDDNDVISDELDLCERGITGWQSTPSVDHDMDGCLDQSEDEDDDNDSVLDYVDQCPKGVLDWTTSDINDHDSDGCRDGEEDSDNDNDGYSNDYDACPTGVIGPWGASESDHDKDGCVDSEDNDMDGDGILNDMDGCPLGTTGWISDRLNDLDGDGCQDSMEDEDDDGDGTVDANQFMLSGEGATYTWTRIGSILAVILLVGLFVRKRKANPLDSPTHAKVDSFFQGDSNDSPVLGSEIRSSTYCSKCGEHGEWYDEHKWAWCHQCEAWVP